MGSLLALSPNGLVAQDSAQVVPVFNLSENVSTLFGERCAGCHGPDSEKRKALRKWSKALDLSATAANPKLIVPGDPDGSDLYLAIDFDEMPPEDSDKALLTSEEKKWIFDWIAAGAVIAAPVVSPQPQPGLDQDKPTEKAANSIEASSAPSPARTKKNKSWMQSSLPRWIGHFHPMVVHFPIALLSVAILAELLARLLRKKSLRGTADFCLVIGILSGIPAAAMGWFLAADTSHRGIELDLHRWLGTSVPILSMLALGIMQVKPKLRIPCFLALAGIVGLTGHLGGGLSFGTDWLDWPG